MPNLSAVMGYAAPAELAASLNAEVLEIPEDILSCTIHQGRSHRRNTKGGKVGGKQLNIGSFTVPIGLAIFFASVAVSLLSAWLVDRKRRDVEPVILVSVLIGLAVARVSFVMHYLPAYGGDFVKMLDIRDTGFTPLPGVIAGIASVILALVRRRNGRPPLVVGATLGLITWFAASAAASAWQPAATAPDIALTNAGGGITALKFHDGKPLVVNLWATWCAPCQDEMPVLADMQRTNAGIDLVFVNQGESSSTVEAFMNRLDLHIVKSMLDPSLEVAKATAVTAYPTTLFYDASGRLVDKHVGRFSRATFSAALDRLYPPAGTHAKK